VLLLSVNAGMPQDVTWHGRTSAHGGLEEAGHRAADGTAAQYRRRRARVIWPDTAGEQRAVFVYQIESYRYWAGTAGPG